MKGHTDATKVFTQACKKWADIINNMKFNATNFGLLRYEKNRKQNLQQLTNHIMIQSTTTKNKSVLCTYFHSSYKKYNFKRLETRWQGVESVSVAEALSYADTLEISCHSPTRVLLPVQTKNQKIFKTWNTVCYSVPDKQKPNKIHSTKCNSVFGPLLYNSLPKYLRDVESVKTKRIKLELDKFLELIPDELKMPNYVTTAGSNSILDQLTHLRVHGIYRRWWSPRGQEQSYPLRNHSKYPSK